ncbi:MAG: hypothetical protein ACKOU7_13670 [Ferruginibacter sp.]
MKRNEKLIPIEGIFSPDEAKEILMNMIKSKINFHNIKNWSSNERFGKDDETAKRRIPELKKDLEKLETILAEAKTLNKKLIVDSEINIILSGE